VFNRTWLIHYQRIQPRPRFSDGVLEIIFNEATAVRKSTEKRRVKVENVSFLRQYCSFVEIFWLDGLLLQKRRTCFYCFLRASVTVGPFLWFLQHYWVLAFYSESYTGSESVEESLRISQSANLYVNHRTSVQMRIGPASCYQTSVDTGSQRATWRRPKGMSECSGLLSSRTVHAQGLWSVVSTLELLI